MKSRDVFSRGLRGASFFLPFEQSISKLNSTHHVFDTSKSCMELKDVFKISTFGTSKQCTPNEAQHIFLFLIRLKFQCWWFQAMLPKTTERHIVVYLRGCMKSSDVLKRVPNGLFVLLSERARGLSNFQTSKQCTQTSVQTQHISDTFEAGWNNVMFSKGSPKAIEFVFKGSTKLSNFQLVH